jgi:hypothetical protein
VKSLLPFMFALMVLAAACGISDEQNGAPQVGGLDTSEAGIIAFVKDRRYQGWLAEPSVHDSSGPHGQVRVFFNDAAVQSLRAGNDTHPVGTVLVKELYSSDGRSLIGHALDVKVEAGPGKDTWLFFEGFVPSYRNNFYGQGHETCHGCHEAGKDYVTTALPQ